MNSPVRKAVVLMVEPGARFFPASHILRPELFPVVGPDGAARALFHYHLLELDAAGFKEVCLVVPPGVEATIRAYLTGPDNAGVRGLSKFPVLQGEAMRMRGLAGRVRFVVQPTPAGAGDAVHQCRDLVGDEPFLLCSGVQLFRGAPLSPYVALTRAWTRASGRSVSAVERIGPDQIHGRVCVAGTRRASDPGLIDVSRIIEKPAVEVARATLRVDGLGADEFLGWSGLHVLAPSIFAILDGMIRDDARDEGEFQLTRAQEIQRQREGGLALEMTGVRRFDFSTPTAYAAALRDYATAH